MSYKVNTPGLKTSLRDGEWLQLTRLTPRVVLRALTDRTRAYPLSHPRFHTWPPHPGR